MNYLYQENLLNKLAAKIEVFNLPISLKANYDIIKKNFFTELNIDSLKLNISNNSTFKSDLLEDGSYLKAMEGCAVVFHTASPFNFKVTDNQRGFVDPAFKGTRNVLDSVNKTDDLSDLMQTILKIHIKQTITDGIQCI